ncbi:MAG: hypothetical protein ONB23_12420 [candidate division KSB1 bacterium]|nr:hypothetical protein [candidate division KSB1 bacterium]
MNRQRKSFGVLLPLVLGLSLTAQAAEPSFRHFDDFQLLIQGEIRGVWVADDGTLRLGPQARLIWESQTPFVWDVASDPNTGALYFAAGASGIVYRLQRDTPINVIFEAQEVLVTALATDGRGNIYFGTSPEARIYHISQSGSPELVCDLPDTYVWRLKADPEGSIWIATGEKARLYRLRASGQVDTVLTLEESHLRSLAMLGKDTWLLGTSPNGHVCRLSPAGKAFVLWDSPLDEVVSLMPAGEGRVVVASLGPVAPASEQAQATASDVAGRILAGRPAKQRSLVSLLENDGSTRELWNSTDEQVFVVTAFEDGYLLGTGPEGRLYGARSDGRLSLLASLGPCYILSVSAQRSGSLLLCTANPGKVFELSFPREGKGEYISPVLDARILSQWGSLHWKQEGKGQVRFYTRSGNTEKPTASWSAWAPLRAGEGSPRIDSPPARFLQWKLEMVGDRTLKVYDVAVSYRQQNAAPVLRRIFVYAPNQVYSGAARAESYQRGGQGEGLTSPKSLGERKTQSGFRTCSWEFEDPNGDKLVFRLEVRRRDWPEWKLLADQMVESAFCLDTRTLPEGTYRFRVTASDAPSNPINEARTATLESEEFVIDHTPPTIEDLRAVRRGTAIHLDFRVRDNAGRLQAVDISVGAGPWQRVASEDGLVDSPAESFHLELEAAESALVASVRASDESGNTSHAWVRLP